MGGPLARTLGTPSSGGGGGGVAHYVHTESPASFTWVVQHNLGGHPAVDVTDSAGTRHYGQIHDDSLNQLTITFNTQISGTADCKL